MMNVFFGVYNFCKVYGTLKTTPAVAAGIADRPWSIGELLERTGVSYAEAESRIARLRGGLSHAR